MKKSIVKQLMPGSLYEYTYVNSSNVVVDVTKYFVISQLRTNDRIHCLYCRHNDNWNYVVCNLSDFDCPKEKEHFIVVHEFH